ncbi:unnamed protein product [Owenia fusiformis]|uniref:Uncharacterized protein n=1 Tax=Owenia fusiformis TaxID=6347 RepID=A0A8J1TS29_OWEFU|nr:unnamed protein product [Owenia fusiformis]
MLYQNNAFFSGNIAVADMIVGLSTIGDSMLAFMGWTSMYSCATVYSFIALSCTTSVSLLAALATNQCYAIAYPIHHRKCFKVEKICLVIGVIWLTCGLVNVIALICNITSKKEQIFPKEGCLISLSFDKDYVLCFCTFLMLSLLYIVLTYTKIIATVKRQAHIIPGDIGINREVKSMKHEQTLRLTRKLIGVILLFLICWTPFTIAALIWGTCSEVYTRRLIEIPSCVIEQTFTITAGIALTHSCMNFLFYICTFKKFREALCKGWCCHRNQNGTNGNI